jgi:hypothetical protein
MTKAELQKMLTKQLPAYKARLDAVRALDQRARDSVQAGDQKSFDDTIELTKKPSKVTTVDEIDAIIKKSGLEKDVDVRKIRDQLAPIQIQVNVILDRIRKMRMPAGRP